MMTKAKPKQQTVTEVIDEIRSWEQKHKPYDYFGKLPLFQFWTDTEGKAQLVPLSENLEMPAIQLKQYAFEQLLYKLDYPKKLWEKLPHQMATMDMNWLIQNTLSQSEDIMIRMQDENQARALLSKHYTPFDILELLELVQPHAADGIVRWKHFDEVTFHMSISFKHTATEVKVGEVVEHGIHISNSEVGARSITIAGFVYVLTCTNGNVSEQNNGGMFRMRHIGNGDKVEGMVKSAIQQAQISSEGLVAGFKRAVNVAIEEPYQVMENLAKRGEMTMEQMRSCLDAYMLAPEHAGSLYGVSQAISRAAQQYTGEPRYDMQRLAGNVCTRNALALTGGV